VIRDRDPGDETDPRSADEVSRVFRWRLKVAVGIGCDTDLASQIAASHLDLRDLERLIHDGCDPTVAFRILD
jgi:hypothetical protein